MEEEKEEESEKKVNSSNIFLIIFGVLTFIFIIFSLILLNGMTANVIGDSRGNYYGIIFILGLVGLVVFFEILLSIKKKEKPKKNIHELLKEYSK